MEVCVFCEVSIDLLSVVYMNRRPFVGPLVSSQYPESPATGRVYSSPPRQRMPANVKMVPHFQSAASCCGHSRHPPPFQPQLNSPRLYHFLQRHSNCLSIFLYHEAVHPNSWTLTSSHQPLTIPTPLFSCHFYQKGEWAKPVNRLTSRCSFSHPRNQVSLTVPPNLPFVYSYYILRLSISLSLRVHIMFTHALLSLCQRRLCPTHNRPLRPTA